MSDTEQGSVLGGVVETVESGLEAVGHAVVAGVDLAEAGIDLGTMAVERFAAAGTEFIGVYAWRDQVDRASEYAEKLLHKDLDDAGDPISLGDVLAGAHALEDRSQEADARRPSSSGRELT